MNSDREIADDVADCKYNEQNDIKNYSFFITKPEKTYIVDGQHDQAHDHTKWANPYADLQIGNLIDACVNQYNRQRNTKAG